MKKYYKLTNQKMRTYDGFQWVLEEWQEAEGSISKSLCTDAWLHCYDSPLLAVLHNPIHADIKNPRLFEVEVDGKSKNDNGVKHGFREMRLVKELPLPKITTIQKIAYSILCAKEVYREKTWNKWADNWLLGKNRIKDTAANAAAANAGAVHAANAAVHAANAAVHAADDTAYAAADAAYNAAYAAADAAYTTYATNIQLNLIQIAEKAVKEF